MYYVYLPTNHLYVGCSSNVNNRIIHHTQGEGAEFTKHNKKFYLVYSEQYPTLPEARRRERQIKGWRRKRT